MLSPESENHACTASVYDGRGISFEMGGRLICEFLSKLAWSANSGVSEFFVTGSYNLAHPGLLDHGTFGRSALGAVAPWNLLNLPDISHAKASLGVALFTEGMGIRAIPFAFLSYFKVLNASPPAAIRVRHTAHPPADSPAPATPVKTS